MDMRNRWHGFSVLLALLLVSSGCATNRYMGISLKPGAADPGVQALAARSSVGDKQAQFELGIRFEEGNGVPQDTTRAIQLYRQAASDSGGTIWIYVPSPGNGASARVIPFDKGPRQAGLEQAKRRVAALDSSTSEHDRKEDHGQ